MADFFRNLVEDMKDEDTNIMGDGKGSAEYSGTVDSGSYMLNAVLSGSIFGGVPNNKVTAFAGESATGKTFFVLGVVKQFLQDNPDGGIVYYDTEAAVTKQMMEERGVDTSRVIISEPDTIQKFRTHAMKTIDMYEKSPDRPPMMFILDSLGLLSTEKEVADTAEGKDVRDMTKSQLIKGAFRVLTLKLAKIGVPMIVTNHVYEVIGSYMPQKEMGGGSGLKYAASTIAYLSKKKVRDGTDITGIIIKAKMFKSRISKENAEAEVLLSYTGGLDRYYGLLEFGEKHGIFKKSGNRYEMGESKLYGKQILKDPEKYFTEEVLKQIDEKVSQEFKYGTA
jgi:RecA/RadA recombinase|tara:strand:- start:6572 stop:7582 length:1011 start_codon:yes stop_codon:yes gene_type:complete